MPYHHRLLRIALSTLGALLMTGLAATAEDKRPSRLGTPSTIESVRETSYSGDYVTIQGDVVIAHKDGLYELKDDTGNVLVVIPESLRRELGDPEKHETIRVFGKWDHDPTVASKRAEKIVGGPRDERTWGIRVQRLERNLSSGSTNPAAQPWDEEPVVTTRPKPAAGTPAAIQEGVQVRQPQADAQFKQRLRAARERVNASQKSYDEASTDYARALHQGVEGAELEKLAARKTSAEAALQEASAAIPPLAAEARSVGVDESLIQIYEQGTSPTR